VIHCSRTPVFILHGNAEWPVYIIKQSSIEILQLTGFGRVEPKRTQGCLPKSCHSLNLGMENFASILSGRFWPKLRVRQYQQAKT
jgi:hypothetical protein